MLDFIILFYLLISVIYGNVFSYPGYKQSTGSQTTTGTFLFTGKMWWGNIMACWYFLYWIYFREYTNLFGLATLGTRASTAMKLTYCKTSNMRCTLVGNKIVYHLDVVGASPVGAASTTFRASKILFQPPYFLIGLWKDIRIGLLRLTWFIRGNQLQPSY